MCKSFLQERRCADEANRRSDAGLDVYCSHVRRAAELAWKVVMLTTLITSSVSPWTFAPSAKTCKAQPITLACMGSAPGGAENQWCDRHRDRLCVGLSRRTSLFIAGSIKSASIAELIPAAPSAHAVRGRRRLWRRA